MLHIASSGNQFHVLSFLIECGCALDIPTWNEQRTALMLACMEGATFCAARLICAGSDINMCSNNKRTALHFACADGQFECMELLLRNGANVYAVDSGNRIPLHLGIV